MLGRVKHDRRPKPERTRGGDGRRTAVRACIDDALRDASGPDAFTGAQVVDLLLDLRTKLVATLRPDAS